MDFVNLKSWKIHNKFHNVGYIICLFLLYEPTFKTREYVNRSFKQHWPNNVLNNTVHAIIVTFQDSINILHVDFLLFSPVRLFDGPYNVYRKNRWMFVRPCVCPSGTKMCNFIDIFYQLFVDKLSWKLSSLYCWQSRWSTSKKYS